MWWNSGREHRSGDRADRRNPIAYFGFALIIFGPIAAKLMGVTISRQRESLADVSACHMTRYPPGLISALEKLQEHRTATHSASTATAHLWIEQPMSGLRSDHGHMPKAHGWFDTHPPLEERIALLREL
jgi:heat shock protein HtpX